MKARHSVKEAYAVYNGGNSWLFYGTTKSGNYFMADDNGNTMIFNEDPSDLDESLNDIWQFEHFIVELIDSERENFFKEIITYLLETNDSDHRGGITNNKLKKYAQI